MTPTVVKSFDIPGEFDFLSNFYEGAPFKVNLPDKTMEFASGEHAYQAYKAFAVPGVPREEQYAMVDTVASAKTPGLAKKAGRKIKIDVATWDDMKDYCMRIVVFEKFAHNPDLVTRLLDTGAAMLVEGNTWGDLYWGRMNGKGLNRLGAILMEVRGHFYYQTRLRPISEQTAHILMGW